MHVKEEQSHRKRQGSEVAEFATSSEGEAELKSPIQSSLSLGDAGMAPGRLEWRLHEWSQQKMDDFQPAFRFPYEYEFQYFFDLREATMTHHFSNAGMIWDEMQLRVHMEVFAARALRIILLGARRIGCINVIVGGTEIHISHFCIEPAFQNRGIGFKVMELIIAESSELDLPLELDVLKANKAAALYERLGFAYIPGENNRLYYMRRPVSSSL